MTGGNDRRHTGILSYLAGSNNSLVLSGTATHLRGVLCVSCAVGAMTQHRIYNTQDNAWRLKQVAKTSSPYSPETWLLDFFSESSHVPNYGA